MTDNTPNGIIAILSSPEGWVDSVTDFDTAGYGGFELWQAQKMRCKRNLAFKIVRDGCAPYIAKALSEHSCQSIMWNLVTEQGYKLKFIAVGHNGIDPND